MDATLSVPSGAPDAATAPVPLPFGQNVLGITFLSDDWEDDIPLEYFEDEGKVNPFGDGGDNG